MNANYFTKFAIDLTSKCNARCPFCPRNSRMMEKVRKNPKDLSLNLFKKIFPLEYLKNMRQILYNGNLGEPSLSKNIIPITEYVADTLSRTFLWMSTNGSTHDKDWWSDFAKIFSFNNINTVRFSIDGLREEHTRYRKGTHFFKVIENMRSFIKAGGKAEWQFLIFEYNEHQIEEARTLAENLGCEKFILLNSRMYDEHYRKPKSKDVSTKQELCMQNPENKLFCTALHDKCLYLSHDGFVYPCCDYALFDQIFNKIEKYPAKMYIEYLKSKDMINMRKSTIDEALKSPFFKYVFENMDDLARCKVSCKIFQNNFNQELMDIQRFQVVDRAKLKENYILGKR